MITVYYEKYWSDYHRKEFVQGFDSLEDVADWIFGQMRRNYSDKETMCMSFPHNNKAFAPGNLPYAIEFNPEISGPTIYIHMLESDGQIIFSDGRMTAGQKHWTNSVRLWCEGCRERQYAPKFKFAED